MQQYLRYWLNARIVFVVHHDNFGKKQQQQVYCQLQVIFGGGKQSPSSQTCLISRVLQSLTSYMYILFIFSMTCPPRHAGQLKIELFHGIRTFLVVEWKEVIVAMCLGSGTRSPACIKNSCLECERMPSCDRNTKVSMSQQYLHCGGGRHHCCDLGHGHGYHLHRHHSGLCHSYGHRGRGHGCGRRRRCCSLSSSTAAIATTTK